MAKYIGGSNDAMPRATRPHFGCFFEMRFTITGFLLALMGVSGWADTLTYPDLVHRYTDMEGLAVLPPVGEKTALASSYDRASQYDATTDKYNW